MKKIIGIMFVTIFLSTSFSFAKTCKNLSNCVNNECKTVAGEEQCIETQQSAAQVDNELECTSPLQTDPSSNYTTCCMSNTSDCVDYKAGDSLCFYEGSSYNLCNKIGEEAAIKTPTQSVMGITCGPDELVNGQCKLNIYDTLGIRKSVRNDGDATSVGLFVQDIVLSATFFIGTLVTVALIVSGIMFIFAASSGKDPANAKKGMVGSLVGLLVVVSSYIIIRLVQYIAKGF